jgi:hypothetical protein
MVEDLKFLKDVIELFDERGWSATHPAYVAVQKEADVLVNRLAGDVDLRTREMIASHHSDVGLAYPATTRSEMAEVLASHSFYHESGRTYFSWNIKLRDYIEASDAEYDFNPDFDDRWDQLVQRDSTVFDEAVENVLRRYFEGEYAALDDTKDRKATFATGGRSGGHLLLSRFELPDARNGRKAVDMSAASDAEMHAWILDEMEDEEIVALYGLVVSVDADVDDRNNVIAHELGYIRSLKEESWSEAQENDETTTP